MGRPTTHSRSAWHTANKRRVCTALGRAKPYSVSFKDLQGVKHEVRVEADSLFEAAVLAMTRVPQGQHGDDARPAVSVAGRGETQRLPTTSDSICWLRESVRAAGGFTFAL